jgi:hypothetical protein
MSAQAYTDGATIINNRSFESKKPNRIDTVATVRTSDAHQQACQQRRRFRQIDGAIKVDDVIGRIGFTFRVRNKRQTLPIRQSIYRVPNIARTQYLGNNTHGAGQLWLDQRFEEKRPQHLVHTVDRRRHEIQHIVAQYSQLARRHIVVAGLFVFQLFKKRKARVSWNES